MESRGLDSQGSIRPATAGDLERIAEIESLCFDPPWTDVQFSTGLKGLFLVFEGEEEILGFLIACIREKGERATIMKIAVHPDHRHHGIASKLISACLDQFRQKNLQSVELDVDIVKNGAIKLYEKFGFKAVQIATVDDEEDTSFLIMKLLLRHPNNS
jgi:[ribosomal protein S18]-alanine N-acetyltransferase